MTEPLLSVVVVSWNTRALLQRCLASLRLHLTDEPHEMIVVDNASADDSPDMVRREFPEALLMQSGENLGFGRGCNLGMARAKGDFILLLNSDARLVDKSILGLVARMRREPRIAMIGPRIQYEDGTLQASAQRFTTAQRLLMEELGLYKLLPRAWRADALLGGYWDHSTTREVDWLIGACLIVRHEVYAATRGFDPEIFLYGEDEEWCSRIRAAGGLLVFDPSATVVHAGHASGLRLEGPDARLARCLSAADRLIARRQGSAAVAVARGARVIGAAAKLAVFGASGRLRQDDVHGRNVRWTARTVLRHYLTRGPRRTTDRGRGVD